jgi:hypothetical protein
VIVREDIFSVGKDVQDMRKDLNTHIENVNKTRAAIYEKCSNLFDINNTKIDGVAQLLSHNMEVADAGIRHMNELTDKREEKIIDAIKTIRDSRGPEITRFLMKFADVQKKHTQILADKLDGVASRLDKLNANLERSHAMNGLFDEDEVNYDMLRLKESLNSLGSVHMYSGDEEDKKKYVSNPEMPLFHRYNKD